MDYDSRMERAQDGALEEWPQVAGDDYGRSYRRQEAEAFGPCSPVAPARFNVRAAVAERLGFGSVERDAGYTIAGQYVADASLHSLARKQARERQESAAAWTRRQAELQAERAAEPVVALPAPAQPSTRRVA